MTNQKCAPSHSQHQLMSADDFLFSLRLDNINLFTLREYVASTRLEHKVSGTGHQALWLKFQSLVQQW